MIIVFSDLPKAGENIRDVLLFISPLKEISYAHRGSLHPRGVL
jgi:hypothetical protein